MVIVLTAIFALVVLYFVYNNLNSQTSTNPGAKAAVDAPAGTENPDTVFLEKPAIINGDFEQGGLGWNNNYAVQKDENGNHYIMNNASWDIRQDMNLLPHTTYQIKAQTKKGTAQGPARIVFTFHDVNGNKLPQYYDIRHTHTGNDWEDIAQQYIAIPEKAAITKIYLLTSDPKGYHYFDNIVVTRTSAVGDRANLQADQNEKIANGDFELGLFGWVGESSLITEENDNKFLRNGYNWSLYQQVEVEPEQIYVVKATTRTPDVQVPTRIKVVFLDEQGQRIPEFYNIVRSHTNNEWNDVTEVIKIPAGIHQARIYLLANDDSAAVACDFDNVSLKLATGAELNNLTRAQTEDSRNYLGNHTEYVVKPGDTASGIAEKFGVDLKTLIDENNITNPNSLEVGQILYIPVN
ncbi:LysM peptidoglycan-binding domain-containing protein [Desulfallas thermosapovorans]|uniref:LysM domain-containing protein n=1 Tax=Desulfallas thermosapovorans DSM 6562 TaxID=1121431 RepID=A0A5S4ZUH7_9FIRM|nr:LysM peptidoglycan-binding domain-containing protein [Desulfallas thermosapovorans]TYO96452.1 LysM domain-containing protein [Desulfallas thermosapovorans DSM 6562]